MILFRFDRVLSVSALLLICSTAIGAEPGSAVCTQKDFEYAKFWDDYDPVEAYEFGLKIQQFVRDRDLDGLLQLAAGELVQGPRKAYAKDKAFSDIFDEEWRANVLSEPPSCSPVGWRGFMLSSGQVWYNKVGNQWQLVSFNGATEQKHDVIRLPVEWKISGKTLPPQCFVGLWMSGDNYEEYESQFVIATIEDFESNPGKYFGKEVSTLEPIIPSWSSDGETLSLVTDVAQCFSRNHKITVDGRKVQSEDCDEHGYCESHEYEILTSLSTQQCKLLAPHMPGNCLSAYLINVSVMRSNSYDIQHVIYGDFALENGKRIVAPLKNFNLENDARNFMDTLNK